MAKAPPPTTDLTVIVADIASLKARMSGCEANIQLLRNTDAAFADRLALVETGLAHDEARLDALEAGGGGTPPPVDGNVYPFHFAQTLPGNSGDFGSGPDQLQFTVGVHNGSGASELAIILNGMSVVAPVALVAVPAGEPYDVTTVVTVHGAWGAAVPVVQIVPTGIGLHNLNYLGVAYNFVPLVYNGPGTFRGDGAHVNSPTVWNNFDLATTWTAPVAVVPEPPAPPAPVLSVVHGATMNGLPLADGTVAELIARGVPGDKLLLPEGTFVGTAPIPVAMEVAGAGMGLTTIDCTGLKPTYLKGVLVPLVSGALIRDLTLKGAHIAAADGGNAAGIRNNDPDVDFSVLRVQITGCDNGVLTHPCVVDMTDCWTHGNGNSNVGGGSTHEMYFNGQDGRSKVTLTRHRSEAGHLATHALKSRASTLVVVDSTFVGNGDDGTNGGAVVDIPNGGSANFTNCHISMGAGAGNHTLVEYATDAATNAPYGTRLTFGRVVVQDTSGTGGLIKSGLAGANMTIVDSDYVGSTKPVYAGWANVDGDFIPLVVV